MKRFFQFIRVRSQHAIASTRRYPLTVLLSVIFFFWSIFLIQDRLLPAALNEFSFRITLLLLYALVLSFTLSILLENTSLRLLQRGLIWLGAAALLAVVWFGVLNFRLSEMPLSSLASYIGIWLATLLAVLLDPALRQGDLVPHRGLEILKSAAWTALFSLVIFLGGQMVLVMLTTLFEVRLNYFRVTQHMLSFIVFIFAMPFFLSGLQPRGQTAAAPYSRLFHILLNWVLLPLALLYTAILYVFSLRILILQVWPQGVVSHLILWYSFFVIVLWIFLNGSEKPLARPLKWFPLTLLPLMVMLFVAVGLRIQSYGITPNRYFVLLGGIFASLSLIWLVVRQGRRQQVIVVLAMLFVLVGTIGPLSGHQVSARSQAKRLVAALSDQRMLDGSQIVPRSDLSREARDAIYGPLNWLTVNGETARVAAIPKDYRAADLKRAFGFDAPSGPLTPMVDNINLYLDEKNILFETGQATLAGQIQLDAHRRMTRFGEFSFELRDDQLHIKQGSQTLAELKLDFLIARLGDRQQNSVKEPIVQEITRNGRTVRIHLLEFWGEVADDTLKAKNITFFVLID